MDCRTSPGKARPGNAKGPTRCAAPRTDCRAESPPTARCNLLVIAELRQCRMDGQVSCLDADRPADCGFLPGICGDLRGRRLSLAAPVTSDHAGRNRAGGPRRPD